MSHITNVSKITPNWDDVIIVHVDFGKLPPHRREEMMTNTMTNMKLIFPNNKIVICSGSTNIKLEKDEALEILLEDAEILKEQV